MSRDIPPIDRRDGRLAILVLLVALVVYNANFRMTGSGDSYGTRFIPFAIWGHGTLYLDELREVATQLHEKPYWLASTADGHTASVYPVVTPILVTPLYGPAVLYLQWAGWSYENVSRVGILMEKLAASCVASVAAVLMFFVLRRRLDRPRALFLTGAFTFGTSTWAVSSQALWQHGPAEMLLLAALWLITGEPSRINVLAAGLATGLLAANRPPDVLLAAGLSLFALFWARRQAVLFALAAAVPVVLAIAYNWVTYRHPAGGYAGSIDSSFFAKPILEGFAGLLVSPGVGLFVYCPFLLFLPLLFRRGLRDRYRLLTIILAVCVVFQVILYAPTDWRSGYAYGPRYLTDAVPILIWMLAPIVVSLGRPALVLFTACCLFAMGVQYIGAFHFSGKSFHLYYAQPPGPGEMRNVWEPRHAGFLVEAANARRPARLLDTLLSLADPVPPSHRPWRLRPTPRPDAKPPRAPRPSDFYTVPPCVLLDPRHEGPLYRNEEPRRFRIAGAGCAIPASAVAVTGQIVVLDKSGSGSLLLDPDGTGRSDIEVSVDVTPRSLHVILPLAADGSGTVTAAATAPSVSFLFEVDGYFAPVDPFLKRENP